MRVLASRLVVLLVGCVLVGCAGSGGGGGNDGGSQSSCKPPPPDQRISYTANIQPIYNRSCALSGCHVPGSLGGNLDLSTGNSYRQTVNHDAFQQPKKKRVKPGDPDGSYLVQKIEGTPGISGLPMPQGCPVPPPGGSCLGPDDVDAIRMWITQCATSD
jgi:hypothetical protein